MTAPGSPERESLYRDLILAASPAARALVEEVEAERDAEHARAERLAAEVVAWTAGVANARRERDTSINDLRWWYRALRARVEALTAELREKEAHADRLVVKLDAARASLDALVTDLRAPEEDRSITDAPAKEGS